MTNRATCFSCKRNFPQEWMTEIGADPHANMVMCRDCAAENEREALAELDKTQLGTPSLGDTNIPEAPAVIEVTNEGLGQVHKGMQNLIKGGKP